MYELNIYTWPAMMGNNTELEKSQHLTPQSALEYLEDREKPFCYAVLLEATDIGWEPCDWEGNSAAENTWPHIGGENGLHPDFIALQKDWGMLVNMVHKKYVQDGGAMIDIARRLLSKRHPNICGWSEKIAWQAAGDEICVPFLGWK